MFIMLKQYLDGNGLLAVVQLAFMAALVHVLIVGLITSLVPGRNASTLVASQLAQALAQVCIGLGLLLTFSGVYQMVTAGAGQDQNGLSLALGSSALGYSAWVFCAFGTLVDAAFGRGRKRRRQRPVDREGGLQGFRRQSF